MKKNTIPILLLLAGMLFLGTSYYEASRYTPVFMKRSELEKSVSWMNTGRPMKDPGKIYVRGTELFINEKYKGVHIVDNSDPQHPDFKAFIAAPGCIDMAVKGNIVYLDNAVDLVAFDLETKQVTQRIKDFLPEHPAPDGQFHYYGDRPEGLILVGWKEVTDK
jgi:hypothetical protein